MRPTTAGDQRLTDDLAVHVLGWRLAPDRYITEGRSWIAQWRFRPLVELADAFRLLDQAADCYSLTRRGSTFTAEVRIKCHRGKAVGRQLARTITNAVASALGLEVEK
jgi:hypothetical protein